MNYAALEHSPIFKGIPEAELRELLQAVPYHVQHCEKDETIFYQMDPAERIGIILDGSVQAQKMFPNGSQVNVSTRRPGDIIGPAAAFSESRKYPCDVTATEPSDILIIRREDVLRLMQSDLRILENFLTEISTAAYMLQQRIELFSYTGIAKKAAFWLLMKQKESGRDQIPVPGSMTKWAMLMNVSRTSLHRELKKMETLNQIQYSSHAITIKDADGLQEMLSD